MRKYILPAFLVVLAATWEFLIQFTFIDAILTKLRTKGAGGVFMANFLASPTAIWALILVAAILLIAGIRESRAQSRLQSNDPAQLTTPSTSITGPIEAYQTPIRELKESPSPSPATDVELGRLDCYVADEDTGDHLRGATVIAKNDQTDREYKGTTNREGCVDLRVPRGYYTVTVQAPRYLSRTDAAKVPPKGIGIFHVRLQMDESGRWLFNYNVRKNVIERLMELSKEGSALLDEAHAWNDPEAVQKKLSKWEAKSAAYVIEIFGSAEETMFLSDSTLEIILDSADLPPASAAHKVILNRVNALVIRLNKLVERVNADMDKMMLWS